MKIKSIKETIIQLEKSLFSDAVRSSKSKLNSLIADDFIEVSSTGLRFGKDNVMSRLPTEDSFTVKATGFECRLLSNDTAMLLYQSAFKRGDSDFLYSHRCSIWQQQSDSNWQMIYHQGTKCEAFEIVN
ncbi:DUF4440 domain-containing protein [Parashewanella curva]|uniref:nuclear transport factor 2 family protein n=1 Tax=Parashewanella curva TaxID=2338552 RepID=UPI001404BE6D|nr:nuclear transport factor 2 family protein [Parashewanella curva]